MRPREAPSDTRIVISCRADQQHEPEGNFGDGQRRRDKPTSAAQTGTRCAIFHHARVIRRRHRQRGCEAKQNTREDPQRGRKGQHGAINANCAEVRQISRYESNGGIKGRGADHQAGDSAEHAEQGDLLFCVEGRSNAQDAKGDARVRFASSDYFTAMGIPLVRGRVVTAQDAESSEPVIVVNRSLAEHFWPNGDALGAFVWIGQPMGPAQAERAPRRIVGVVGDIRGYSVADGLSDDMYEPAAQSLGAGAVSFAVRSNEDLGTLAPHVGDVVRATLPNQPVTAFRSMDDVITTSASVRDQRFHAVLLGLFGALGLLIVIVGVYGVVSYAVAQRTHEFGVRLALGASPSRIRTMVLRDGLALAVAGTTVGLTSSLALTRLLGSLLFDVPPRDPLILATASVVMVVVALGACWTPARRATRVDPLVALRCE
jgi:predicted permease